MNYVIGLCGIVIGFLLIKYREPIGDMVGEPEWIAKVGGIYNMLILIGVIVFFWSLAFMTNTQDILFAPLLNILPFGRNGGGTDVVPATEF